MSVVDREHELGVQSLTHADKDVWLTFINRASRTPPLPGSPPSPTNRPSWIVNEIRDLREKGQLNTRDVTDVATRITKSAEPPRPLRPPSDAVDRPNAGRSRNPSRVPRGRVVIRDAAQFTVSGWHDN